MCGSCSAGLLLFPLLLILPTSSAPPMFHSWLHLALLCLPPLVGARYSNNPSTGWALSEFYNSSNDMGYYRYTNFTDCSNITDYYELLNENGLYGKPIGGYSAHYYMPYTVYFASYFVTSAENICVNKNLNSNEYYPAYYLSVVAVNAFGRTQDPNKGQVIWTANPDRPVTKNACVHFNDTLVALVDYHDNIVPPETVWEINTGVPNLSLAVSFQGNSVLFSNTTNPPYVPLWETFLCPTDTLMVLQVLEKHSTLRVNSSATSNSGNYTLAFNNGRLVLYARIGQLINHDVNPYGHPYWSWPNSSLAAIDNISFAAFCWDSVNQLRLYAGSNRSSDNSSVYRGMVSPEFCSTIPNNSDKTISITGLDPSINATFATFLRLEADGDLRAYTVDNTTYPGSNAIWRAFYNVFNKTPCDLPLYCGSYGMCDPERKKGSYCTCDYSDDPKSVFADASDTRSGCMLEKDNVVRLWDFHNLWRSGESTICPTTANIAACTSKGSRCEIDFLSVDNVRYFYLNNSKNYQGVNDSAGCRGECEKNCSCTAAFWNENLGSCFLVLGQLGTIQQQQGSMLAFIKYVRIRQTSSSSRWMVIGSVLAATLLVLCGFLIYRRRTRAHKISQLQKEHLLLLSLLDGGNTERFTWKQLHEYTCGFSHFLGGGGFGRVFRGALLDGTAIAVKQLDEDRSEGQGDKEFIAEVSILSRIHHAHLVRLIGFCLDGMHRLLVYEYMEHGSLDAWLFKKNVPSIVQDADSELLNRNFSEKDKERQRLPWKTRFEIALGTAKGLAYLHEECEERIIHMDLKPQNILLGRKFVAKISDFGMSTRTGREQTAVMTVMRGTPGYLAPEWLLDFAITEKCDVYSFGIVLLEMVSGRKVKDLTAVKQKLRMRPLRESVMLEFLDEGLRYYGSDVNEEEAVRLVEVALLCVRRDPTKRPAMSSVAWMLEGRVEVVQEVDALDDDDEDVLQLHVKYPSTINRTMRTMMQQQQQQGKLDSFTSSFIDSASSAGSSKQMSLNSSSHDDDDKKKNSYKEKKYFHMDRIGFHIKATSFIERDTSSTAAAAAEEEEEEEEEEWDRLLHNQHTANLKQ